MAHLHSAVGEVTQAPHQEPCGNGECAIAFLRFRHHKHEELVQLEGKNAKARKAILALRTGDRCVAFGRLRMGLPADPYHHCIIVRDVAVVNAWRGMGTGKPVPGLTLGNRSENQSSSGVKRGGQAPGG